MQFEMPFKKLLSAIALSLCVLAMVLGCDSGTEEGEERVAVQGVSLNHSTLTLDEGQNALLIPTFSPTNPTNKAVTVQ